MATDKKILFITGGQYMHVRFAESYNMLTMHIGNTGLGLEVVKALLQSEVAYEIIIGCRTISKGEDASE